MAVFVWGKTARSPKKRKKKVVGKGCGKKRLVLIREKGSDALFFHNLNISLSYVSLTPESVEISDKYVPS